MPKKMPLNSDKIFPKTDAILAYMALRRTHDTIHRHVSKKLAQWNLSVPKYGVLVRLYDYESLPLSELSNQIFRANSNITTLINRMEREGLVRRCTHGKDRRITEIRLTRKGRNLTPKVIEAYKPFLHQLLTECLNPQEQKALFSLCTRIQKILKQKEDEPIGALRR